MVQVLALDAAGHPSEWLSIERAAHYVAKGLVAWDLGDPCVVLRGGINARSGELSTMELKPIISVRCPIHFQKAHKSPSFSRSVLLRRDRLMCAYCGEVCKEKDLTLDHVTPESRGGKTDWMNLVAACRLSPPKNLPVECVSELRPLRRCAACSFRTRGHHQFGSRVHRRAR